MVRFPVPALPPVFPPRASDPPGPGTVPASLEAALGTAPAEAAAPPEAAATEAAAAPTDLVNWDKGKLEGAIRVLQFCDRENIRLNGSSKKQSQVRVFLWVQGVQQRV